MAKWKGLEHKRVVTAGEAFAERLKQVRQRHGLTQAQLADRLRELGYPIDRVTLSKIERGGERAKNVKLEEAFAIAYALDVSPKHLIAPYSMESRVSVVPAKRPLGPEDAREWVAGRWPVTDQDARFFYTELPPNEVDAMIEAAHAIEYGKPITVADWRASLIPDPAAAAFVKRLEMVEKGEAPPIGVDEQEEEERR